MHLSVQIKSFSCWIKTWKDCVHFWASLVNLIKNVWLLFKLVMHALSCQVLFYHNRIREWRKKMLLLTKQTQCRVSWSLEPNEMVEAVWWQELIMSRDVDSRCLFGRNLFWSYLKEEQLTGRDQWQSLQYILMRCWYRNTWGILASTGSYSKERVRWYHLRTEGIFTCWGKKNQTCRVEKSF